MKVSLKDSSTYVYAPRRSAFVERQEIGKITNNLLARNIIQYSSSPYSARVVPVRKKNGSLRLCTDLHPLNDRVLKQKYPFPLIEDCLFHLSNKKVFTKVFHLSNKKVFLDLRDGSHQIDVHPDDTIYIYIYISIFLLLLRMASSNSKNSLLVIVRPRLNSKKD